MKGKNIQRLKTNDMNQNYSNHGELRKIKVNISNKRIEKEKSSLHQFSEEN
jgi:hypothetical protein